MAQINIVARFSAIQFSMKITPLLAFYFSLRRSDRGAELGGLLVGAEQHIEDARQQEDRRDDARHIDIAGEQAAELVDHQGDHIGQAALVAG